MKKTISYQQAMVLTKRAYRHQMQGQLGQAIELYQRSIKTHPTAEAHTYLGWTYSMMGRVDEAIEQCEYAIIVDPTFGNPYNDIGAYLMEQDRPQEALSWFEKALDAERYETPQLALLNLGRAYELIHQPETALTFYDQALELAPLFRPAIYAKYTLLGKLN